ncbi:MAG: NgoBV family restriction endonuclease [Chlorobi bacterium]|nr:NgoBV family restriction endonuclease [Chlorobiota bacterium]
MRQKIQLATFFRTRFKPFPDKEKFLLALNETRYQYPQTRYKNAHWLRKVIENYEAHTGVRLSVE